jgi:hypothetical protein
VKRRVGRMMRRIVPLFLNSNLGGLSAIGPEPTQLEDDTPDFSAEMAPASQSMSTLTRCGM